jgi:hypothetical protein
MSSQKIMSECSNCDRKSYHDPDPNWVCMYCLHSQNSEIEIRHAATITISLYVPKSMRLGEMGQFALNTFVHWYETKIPALLRKMPKKPIRIESSLNIEP